ncbi:GNAT family N-acetyltransferase [Flaviramulus aquimarinus]|uniref:GNAT family N-acetyltransferase n=1 Tax=Flaviramulus aquimarinus TaxID=1170456 RepID=A0ABP9EN67_9FLAO
MKIGILKKDDLNASFQEQISKLFKQLGGNKTQVDLNEVLDKKNKITLVYCSDNSEIIGIASMCTYNVISGKKGWIEDVVVNANSRGKGIGRKLMEKLLEVGKEKNLSQILLFTEDHRLPAIRLYSDLGFKVKDSRIYTLHMK